MGALLHRRKTGRGMYLEQSQVEAGISMLSPAILDYTINGRIMSRNANRDPGAAPHGVYPCQGNDRWIAITVFTNEDWQAFCRALGSPAWSNEEKFATLSRRKENEDELDRLIADWTENHSSEEVMNIMQAAGVSAGAVQTPEDLFKDPQLKHRKHFISLDHSFLGQYSCPNEASRFSRTPPVFRKAGPTLGEDNEYVLREILRFSDDEISDIYAEGAITTEDESPGLGAF
jgi:crotonobetainyl-CoA:carnitine CoA-transferase CaiB-like acyl-CoA transferase